MRSRLLATRLPAVVAAVVAAGLASPALAADEPPKHRVLVELFTSQG